MSTSKPQDKGWKDALLKTSLPLEQLVSEKLERQGFYISGEYPYTRPNEDDLETEFSIDLRVFELLPRDRRREDYWGSLNLLVECKYNYPGVQWVFTPHPPQSLIVIGCIIHLDELCTERLQIGRKPEREPLYTLDYALPFCTRGVVLHSSGADMNAIAHGLNQLRYALPNLVAQECRNQAQTRNDADLHISFICPMLVTTASLHILKRGLDLNAFQSASSLADIAEDVDALIVFQEAGPQLRRYSAQVAKDLHLWDGEVDTRLDALEEVLRPSTLAEDVPKLISDEEPYSYFDRHIEQEHSRILVVRFDALDRIVAEIRRAVRAAGRKRERIAYLPDVSSEDQLLIPVP